MLYLGVPNISDIRLKGVVFPPQAPPAYSVPLGQSQSRFRREYHPFYNCNYKVATPRYIIALQLR